MNNEFRIGDRVFFLYKHLGMFGNVIQVDHDGTRLLVCTDDMRKYEIWGNQVTKITDETSLLWGKS